MILLNNINLANGQAMVVIRNYGNMIFEIVGFGVLEKSFKMPDVVRILGKLFPNDPKLENEKIVLDATTVNVYIYFFLCCGV